MGGVSAEKAAPALWLSCRCSIRQTTKQTGCRCLFAATCAPSPAENTPLQKWTQELEALRQGPSTYPLHLQMRTLMKPCFQWVIARCITASAWHQQLWYWRFGVTLDATGLATRAHPEEQDKSKQRSTGAVRRWCAQRIGAETMRGAIKLARNGRVYVT